MKMKNFQTVTLSKQFSKAINQHAKLTFKNKQAENEQKF